MKYPNVYLKNRINIVISKNKNLKGNPKTFSCFYLALEYCQKNSNLQDIYVIGGEQIYNQALKHPDLDNIYLSKINKNTNCDRFFKWDDSDTNFHLIYKNHIYLLYYLICKNQYNRFLLWEM